LSTMGAMVTEHIWHRGGGVVNNGSLMVGPFCMNWN